MSTKSTLKEDYKSEIDERSEDFLDPDQKYDVAFLAQQPQRLYLFYLQVLNTQKLIFFYRDFR